jgi:Flp pilus assembly protein TadG
MTAMRKHVDMPHAPMKERAQSQKGSVLVEFALILPIFLALVFGMISFSIALYDKTVLTLAAREGARRGALYDKNNYDQNGAFSDTNITSQVSTTAANYYGDLITFGSGTSASTSTVVSGSAGSRTVSVTTSMNYNGLFIFASTVIPMSSTTIMRLEEN